MPELAKRIKTETNVSVEIGDFESKAPTRN